VADDETKVERGSDLHGLACLSSNGDKRTMSPNGDIRICLRTTISSGRVSVPVLAPPDDYLRGPGSEMSASAGGGGGGSTRLSGSMRYQRIAFSQNMSRRSPSENRRVIS